MGSRYKPLGSQWRGKPLDVVEVLVMDGVGKWAVPERAPTWPTSLIPRSQAMSRRRATETRSVIHRSHKTHPSALFVHHQRACCPSHHSSDNFKCRTRCSNSITMSSPTSSPSSPHTTLHGLRSHPVPHTRLLSPASSQTSPLAASTTSQAAVLYPN